MVVNGKGHGRIGRPTPDGRCGLQVARLQRNAVAGALDCRGYDTAGQQRLQSQRRAQVVCNLDTHARGLRRATVEFQDIWLGGINPRSRVETVLDAVRRPAAVTAAVFATKFYTADGNWDLVGNNFPTFFIRDAIKFPDMVHAFKPDPRTNLDDDSRRFDFFSHVPEATRTLTELYSNAGIPASYREMNGNGVHAYKFVNDKDEVHYVKFHWKSLQGTRNFTPKDVARAQGADYSHMTQDLVSHISKGDFPKWDLYVQVLKPQELGNFEFDPLDATKVWPDVALRKVGQMVLNRNPANVFQETEQVAMAPSNLIPGIEPSEDRLLQGRLFSYADTQMYRLGANALLLPINTPKNVINNGNQDGAMNVASTTTGINYQPSRLLPREESTQARYSMLPLSGSTQQVKIQREQNFKQAGDLYRSFSHKERQDLIESFGNSLASADDKSKHKILSFLYKADPEYGTGVTKIVKGDLFRVQSLASKLSD